MAKKDKDHFDKFSALRAENQALRNEVEAGKQTIEMQATLAAETERLLQERQQNEALQRRVQAVETEMAKKDKDHFDKFSALRAENQALRNEVEAGKQTIEKLEGSIAENYNFKILAEQNEMLKADLQSYKNQVANLNNTISTMKIETDILDNYKTKVLQEQNEQFVRRIQQLEKEQRMAQPLLNELVNTLQKHGLTATLQADIDQYQAQVRRSNQMAAESSLAPAKMSAATSSRKELMPLNQSH